jgi:hypothetical protein
VWKRCISSIDSRTPNPQSLRLRVTQLLCILRYPIFASSKWQFLLGYIKNSKNLLRTIEIFEKFKTKEIKGRGSFISYEAGGSGIAYLNYLNKSPKLSAHVVEFADKMFKNQKLTSEGLLTAPWLKDSLDQFMIDCAFTVTPYMLYAGLQAKLR